MGRRLLFVVVLWAAVVLTAAPAGAAKPRLWKLPDATHAGPIAFAPDGGLWFAGSHGSEFPGGGGEFVGRWSPAAGLTEFALPPERDVVGEPAVASNGDYLLPGWTLGVGPDPSVGRITRVTSAGRSREYDLEGRFSGVSALAAAAGEDTWFAASDGGTETGSFTVGRIDAAGNVVGPEYRSPAGCQAIAMAAGGAGAVWFTESCWRDPSRRLGHSASIGEIDALGTLVRYPVSAAFEPFSLAVGADGSVWFGEQRVPGLGRARVGHLDVAGQITEFPLAGVSWPHSIAVGPEGRLWFPAVAADSGLRSLAAIGLTGKISRPVGIAHDRTLEPGWLTAGPDGGIWFTVSGSTASGGGGGTGLLEMARVANEPGFIGRLKP